MKLEKLRRSVYSDELRFSGYKKWNGLSSSDLRILATNPHLFKIGQEPKPSDSKLLGSVVHCLILEPQNFERDYLVSPKFDLRKKEDKASKELLIQRALNENKEIVSEEIHSKALEIAAAFKGTSVFEKYFQDLNNKYEASFHSKLSVNGYAYEVKCRCDCVNFEKLLILDLKTTKAGGAKPAEFAKSVANYGYALQAYFYKFITGCENFKFIAIETEPPYMCSVIELDSIAYEYGEAQILKAFENYANLEKFKEPLYKSQNGDDEHIITLPNWVFYENS